MLTQLNIQLTRTRAFNYQEIERANLFEGLPYIQYDAFVRRDKTMQQVVIRDLLKIIADKLNTLKNHLIDKARMRKIVGLMNKQQKINFNKRLEETMVLIDSIGSIILQEYRKNPEAIGLKLSPIKNIHQQINVNQEDRIYEEDINLFQEMLQFFRDRVEVYMIMVRQPNHKHLDDYNCKLFLKDVTALRFNSMTMSEEIRMLDQQADERIRLIQLALPKSKSDAILRRTQPLSVGVVKPIYDEDEAELQKAKSKRLQELYSNKFNFSKNQIQTRESKIILNQDKLEQEKLLVLESSQKQSKIKHVYADNRKRLAIEKLKNPTKDPNLREALEIMSRVLNINIEDQFG